MKYAYGADKLTRAEMQLSVEDGILQASCSLSRSQTMMEDISPDAYCTQKQWSEFIIKKKYWSNKEEEKKSSCMEN